MASCTVTGKLTDCGGNVLSGIPINFNIQTPGVVIEPLQLTTTSASDGTWSMSLAQGISGQFTIWTANAGSGQQVPYMFNVAVPNTSTATFSSILEDQ